MNERNEGSVMRRGADGMTRGSCPIGRENVFCCPMWGRGCRDSNPSLSWFLAFSRLESGVKVKRKDAFRKFSKSDEKSRKKKYMFECSLKKITGDENYKKNQISCAAPYPGRSVQILPA